MSEAASTPLAAFGGSRFGRVLVPTNVKSPKTTKQAADFLPPPKKSAACKQIIIVIPFKI